MKSEERIRNAERLTTLHFGREKRQIFAPIYLGNHCINDCTYCGFRKGNRDVVRTSLTPSEAAEEARFLVASGVGRILVLAGELPEGGYIDWFCDCLRSIHSVPGVSWIGVELAPLSHGGYLQLLDAGADAFIVFQETYSDTCYSRAHKGRGPKEDFHHRYRSTFEAAEAGFKEIGLGVLLGLSDPSIDVSAMIRHGERILENYPNVLLRCSFPRFRPAKGSLLSESPVPVTEEDILAGIVEVRTSLPRSRIALTARESTSFRLSVMGIATDFGAGGSTTVGGYVSRSTSSSSEQFPLLETSSAEEFKRAASAHGFTLG